MIPEMVFHHHLHLCIPRESGDDPDAVQPGAVGLGYSPRERG